MNIIHSNYTYNKQRRLANEESNTSSLNSPSYHVYLPLPQSSRFKSRKRIFPDISYGNNAESPYYLSIPSLPNNRYSVDHLPKYSQGKRMFTHNRNCSNDYNTNEPPLHLRTRNYNRAQHKEECNSSNNNTLKVVPSEEFLNDYARKYSIREYDIISNNVYEKPGYRPVENKNIFRSVGNICFRDDNVKQKINIINRYKLLNNGKVSENLFNEYVQRNNIKPQFIC